MTRLTFFAVLLTTAGATIFSATAQKPAPAGREPTADQIAALVPLSRAFQDKRMILEGELTKGRTSVPLKIDMNGNLLSFYFSNPQQIIRLDISEKGSSLKESTAGSNRDVPAAMYSAGVRGTDLTYDDVSQRYLFWPKKVKVGEEEIKTRKCWAVDLYNPTRLGEYYLVRIFVDQGSGGLMRMQAYDWNGKLIKVCAVTAGMKIDGVTVLKSMDVMRYVPGTKDITGTTTLRLRKP